jgi:ABC-type glycerol-3-phosphate transport system permease component
MANSGITFNPDRFRKDQWKFHAFLITLSTFMGLPLIFVFNHAFKPYSELFAYPPKFFVRRPTLENFLRLATFSRESGIPISRYIFNSVITTAAVIVLSIIIGSLAAYALSKLEFKGKETLNKINIFSLMFVPVAVAIPRFLVLINIGIYNTYWAHILPLLAMPVGIFLIKQFMDSNVPKELIEAAKIDGAGNWRIYWTLPFYMSTVISQQGNIVVTAGVGAASSLIMIVPNLIIFVFMQNKVMASMATSGIK